MALKSITMNKYLILLIFFSVFRDSIAFESVIRLDQGPVKGFVEETSGVLVFLGIPYARPPIGEYRFQKPFPPIPVNELLVANQWPPICPQRHRLDHLTPANEDCLYLNIWVPRRNGSSLKSVMVFIHGGAYEHGSSSYRYYNGSRLSSLGDVIVVTFNYRLGALGFLYAGSTEAPGNAGLHDMVFALRWIQKNVERFGGNPHTLTVFGESAGGSALSYLLVSPLAEGLIKRAIPMSGVGMEFTSGNPENPVEAAREFARIVDCGTNTSKDECLSNDTIVCLRSVPVDEILKGQYDPRVREAAGSLTGRAFSPVIDGNVIPESPGRRWTDGKFAKDVPLLIGDVLNEGYAVDPTTGDDLPVGSDIRSIWEERVYNLLNSTLLKKCPNRISDVVQFYFGGIANDNSVRFRNAFQDMLTDAYFDCSMLSFAKRYAKFNQVYMYLFQYYSKPYVYGCQDYGPCHGNDLAFTFGTVDGLGDEDKVSREWIKIVSQFAKSGKVDWEPFYFLKPALLVTKFYTFSGTYHPLMVRYAYKEFECKFWQALCEPL